MNALAHAIENLRRAAEDLRRAAEVLHRRPQDEDAKEGYKRALGALNNGLEELDAQFQHKSPTDEEINAAIALVREVEEMVAEGPVRLNILYVLGKLLIARYRQNHRLEDLESAVRAAEEATNTAPVDDQDNPKYRIQLVASLGMLFMHTHRIDALQQAIAEVEILLTALPSTDPRRIDQVNNLARLLGMRYEQTGLGVLADLDRAVNLLLGSVTELPEGDRARVVGLGLLGNLLGMRYEQQGAMRDLDDAIEWSRKALDEAPARHPDRPGMLNNLANRLCRRAQRTGRKDDINEAIRLGEECRKTAPPDHPDQGIWLGNLGTFHGIRLQLMKNPTPGDFDLAIGYAREAIERIATGDPGHWSATHTLANLLLSRYKNGQGSSTVGDLDEAIDALRSDLGNMTTDSPDRAFFLFSLGEALSLRHLRTKPERDGDSVQAREAFAQSWACRNAPVAVRIDAARRAAELWAGVSSWDETALYMERAVDLLHALSPRHLWNTDKQAMIRKFAGLAAAAAAAALNAGKEAAHALQYLELGRGIISGLLLDLRTDLSLLRRRYPDLADKFESLRSKLNSDAVPGSLHAPDGGAGLRREAADQFEALLEEIRAKEGFGEFLLPPSESQLEKTAERGPVVVVNVSVFRCDAFLVEQAGIRALRLRDLTLERVLEEVKKLEDDRVYPKKILEWLWDDVVRPILDELGFRTTPPDANDAEKWPHVWWVPVGPLTYLPLHAAGYHGGGGSAGRAALDRVVSSYSASLRLLVDRRRTTAASTNLAKAQAAVLVSMPTTPGRRPLKYAAAEVAEVREVCPSLNLTPVAPATTKQAVLAALKARPCIAVFHFSGHGVSDGAEPSKSRLLLQDWQTSPLAVADLRDQWLDGRGASSDSAVPSADTAAAAAGAPPAPEQPFLAYLSACSTGENRVLDLADEAVHLANACRLAGFRHAVGTLWPVSDACSVDIARGFYEAVRDAGATDEAAAWALHVAARAVRYKTYTSAESGNTRAAADADGNTPKRYNLKWAPFLHFGV